MAGDSVTTVSELKDMVAVFCGERDWDRFHTNKDMAIGIVTEGSELLELFRFKDEDQIREMMSGIRRTEVEDELSDAFYFILRFAQMNGIDLSSALEAKMRRNAEKYPVETVKGDNRKYDEYRCPESPQASLKSTPMESSSRWSGLISSCPWTRVWRMPAWVRFERCPPYRRFLPAMFSSLRAQAARKDGLFRVQASQYVLS